MNKKYAGTLILVVLLIALLDIGNSDTSSGSGGSGVTSLNSLTGAISLVSNDSSILIQNGVNHITISIHSVAWSLITGIPNIVNDLSQGAHTFLGHVLLANTSNIGWDFNSGTNSIKAILSGILHNINEIDFVNETVCPVNQSLAGWICTNSDIVGIGFGNNAVITLSSTVIEFLTAVNFDSQTISNLVVGTGNGNTVNWGTLVSIPANCAAHNFAIGATSSAFTCAQPALSDVSDYIYPIRVTADIPLSTSTPTIVQNTFATATTGTSFSKAFGSNLGARNTVIVCEGQSSVTTTLGAPTDTLSLSYVSIASQTTSDSTTCWYAMDNSGGADTVTSGTYGTTCSATDICLLFINEIHSSDVAIITGNANSGTTSTSFTCGTGSSGVTGISFSQTPLQLAFYIKTTTGTDTAGANYNLLNGETGSLKYLSEYSNSGLTSTSTTYPATAGTTSIWGCVSLIVREETVMFTQSLNANTNYVFTANINIGTPTGAKQVVYVHNLDTNAAIGDCSTVSSLAQTVIAATDTNFYSSTNPTASMEYNIECAITVGATATTLVIGFNCNTLATTNAESILDGSFMQVWKSGN